MSKQLLEASRIFEESASAGDPRICAIVTAVACTPDAYNLTLIGLQEKLTDIRGSRETQPRGFDADELIMGISRGATKVMRIPDYPPPDSQLTASLIHRVARQPSQAWQALTGSDDPKNWVVTGVLFHRRSQEERSYNHVVAMIPDPQVYLSPFGDILRGRREERRLRLRPSSQDRGIRASPPLHLTVNTEGNMPGAIPLLPGLYLADSEGILTSVLGRGSPPVRSDPTVSISFAVTRR